MTRTLIRLFAGLTFLLTVSAIAATPIKTVNWDDLVPKFATALVDPLAGHDLYRRLEVETIIWARTLNEKERVSDEYKAGVEDAEHYVNDMRQQGLDPEKLVREYKVWQAKVEERNKQVVKALDGAEIKMAGYLLPLEYTEKGETEFLLVPYVGACIHTPAPPPNQIVFVELNKPYKPEELYAPVWITGTMRTKVSVKALSYVDGIADIPTGYSLEASLIETYEEQ
ncbi:MAG: DUF3299 domain-containing protein [Pseudomonadota bacterium]